MFKIKKDKILINRGDIGTITLTIPLDDETDYVFQDGDIISFDVYNVSEYQKQPVIHKEVTISGEGITSVDIVLTSEDTRIGELINKPHEYWYEIELNPDTPKTMTIIGYSKEKGAALFVLLPEGGNKNDTSEITN